MANYGGFGQYLEDPTQPRPRIPAMVPQINSAQYGQGGVNIPGVYQNGQIAPPNAMMPPIGPVSGMLPGQPNQQSIGQMIAGMSSPGGADVSPVVPQAQEPLGGVPGADLVGQYTAQPQGPAAEPSLWDKLATDDTFRMAVLKTGLQMLQPIQPGQTPLGAGAQAISGGVDYLSKQRQLQAQSKLAERKTVVEERHVGAQEKSAEAAATKALETESEKELRQAQAAESRSKGALYDRSLGRNQTKLPATREDFLKQGAIKMVSEFTDAESMSNGMQALDMAADRIYGPASSNPSPGTSAAKGAGKADSATTYKQAREAIKKGADATAVKKRLRDLGLDPNKL